MSSSLSTTPGAGSVATSSTDLKIEPSEPLFKFEVSTRASFEKSEGQDIEGEDMGLEPVDGGKSAWLFMVGAVIIDAIIWGRFSHTDEIRYLEYWAESMQGFL